MTSQSLYIGLMSGTSTDAVDGVLANMDTMQILASASIDIPESLRLELIELNSPGHDELARAARAANLLADIYAANVQALLAQAGLSADQITAIGAHGQTVRHAPDESYTIQLNAPARLAELTSIAVIADFRSRDIAAGGQGAPLVPAFHVAAFGQHKNLAVLNLGGIANLTLLGEPVTGFDTGPANILMDTWIYDQLGFNYDKNGAWAASGQYHAELLDIMLAEPWFALPPPKSTGRDLFNITWLKQKLAALQIPIKPNDVQASLLELTVQSIHLALQSHNYMVDKLIVSGGGADNQALINRLEQVLSCSISSSDEYGIATNLVEAMAFAWLAKAYMDGLPACIPAVTGARKASIAGCYYPA